MTPNVFAAYENAPYPCYLLEIGGELHMNTAAREAGPALSDEGKLRKLLGAAQRMSKGDEAEAATLPLLDEALSMRMLTLIPLEEGLLAVAVEGRDAPVHLFSGQMRESLANIFALLPMLAKRLEDVDLYLAEGVQQNCYDLLRMTSNLEYANQIERRGFETQPVDLVALVDSLCFAADSLIRDNGVPLEWKLPEGPLAVRADAKLLSEAFLNLLRNSIQYTRDGNHIEVRLKAVGSQAVLTVEDQGMGIRPEYLGQIFEPYFSMDPYGDGGMRPGLGLGLSMVREAVAGFGGSVNAESRFGEGTRITLALPLDSGEQNALESDRAGYVTNRYSPVYVQLSGYCRLPGL